MSDDESRTQTPSKRRRLQAREQGLVAHSPELTAAAGLAAGLAALGVWGPRLWVALLGAMRSSFDDSLPLDLQDPLLAVGHLREVALGVFEPLGAILATILAAVVAAHQLQTRGLWCPSRLAPAPARLWTGLAGARQGASLAALASGKAVVLTGLVVAILAGRLPELAGLAGYDAAGLPAAGARALRHVVEPLALGLLALGVLDFGLRWRYVEGLLRVTPEAHREEIRSADGDPAVRRRQRRQAEAWMNDPSDLVVGAAVLVTAGARLGVLLAGEGPPQPVSVRTIARGSAVRSLLAAAERAGLPVVEAPELAQHLARGRFQALPPALADELHDVWPRGSK